MAALQALSRATPDALGPPASYHYWLGLAYTLAYDWALAAAGCRPTWPARPAGGAPDGPSCTWAGSTSRPGGTTRPPWLIGAAWAQTGRSGPPGAWPSTS